MIWLRLFEFALLKRIRRNLDANGGRYIGEQTNAEIEHCPDCPDCNFLGECTDECR